MAMVITLPDNWSEVTLGQWQEIRTLPEDMTDMERLIEVCGILLDKDTEEIRELYGDERKKRKLKELQRKKAAMCLAWVNFIPDLAGEVSLKFKEAVRMPIAQALGLTILLRNRQEENARAIKKLCFIL